MQLRCAGDWNNPWLLRKQPGQRDLRRRSLLLLREGTDQVNQSLVRFTILRAEPWNGVTKVRTIELRLRVDLPCQEALSQRAERNEPDPKFFQRGHHCLFRLSPEQRVLALQRGDGLNRVGAADGLRARFREAEVFYFALLNQFLHCSRHLFDRHIQVDTVLIEQIDRIHLQSPERCLSHLPDVFWPAVQSAPL